MNDSFRKLLICCLYLVGEDHCKHPSRTNPVRSRRWETGISRPIGGAEGARRAMEGGQARRTLDWGVPAQSGWAAQWL